MCCFYSKKSLHDFPCFPILPILAYHIAPFGLQYRLFRNAIWAILEAQRDCISTQLIINGLQIIYRTRTKDTKQTAARRKLYMLIQLLERIHHAKSRMILKKEHQAVSLFF